MLQLIVCEQQQIHFASNFLRAPYVDTYLTTGNVELSKNCEKKKNKAITLTQTLRNVNCIVTKSVGTFDHSKYESVVNRWNMHSKMHNIATYIPLKLIEIKLRKI